MNSVAICLSSIGSRWPRRAHQKGAAQRTWKALFDLHWFHEPQLKKHRSTKSQLCAFNFLWMRLRKARRYTGMSFVRGRTHSKTLSPNILSSRLGARVQLSKTKRCLVAASNMLNAGLSDAKSLIGSRITLRVEREQTNLAPQPKQPHKVFSSLRCQWIFRAVRHLFLQPACCHCFQWGCWGTHTHKKKGTSYP